jgi:hypothetical protein
MTSRAKPCPNDLAICCGSQRHQLHSLVTCHGGSTQIDLQVRGARPLNRDVRRMAESETLEAPWMKSVASL